MDQIDNIENEDLEEELKEAEQEIFDRVADHLLTQNKKSKTTTESCAYRGDEGTKCAIGVLIDDEDYSSEFEGKKIQYLIDFSEIDFWWIVPCRQLILDLQELHDYTGVRYWKDRLGKIAKKHGLEVNY